MLSVIWVPIGPNTLHNWACNPCYSREHVCTMSVVLGTQQQMEEIMKKYLDGECNVFQSDTPVPPSCTPSGTPLSGTPPSGTPPSGTFSIMPPSDTPRPPVTTLPLITSPITPSCSETPISLFENILPPQKKSNLPYQDCYCALHHTCIFTDTFMCIYIHISKLKKVHVHAHLSCVTFTCLLCYFAEKVLSPRLAVSKAKGKAKGKAKAKKTNVST